MVTRTYRITALAWQPVPPGNKVAMVTNGAGPIMAAIDRFEDLGLKLATLSDETMNSFKQHYPATYVLQTLRRDRLSHCMTTTNSLFRPLWMTRMWIS